MAGFIAQNCLHLDLTFKGSFFRQVLSEASSSFFIDPS